MGLTRLLTFPSSNAKMSFWRRALRIWTTMGSTTALISKKRTSSSTTTTTPSILGCGGPSRGARTLRAQCHARQKRRSINLLMKTSLFCSQGLGTWISKVKIQPWNTILRICCTRQRNPRLWWKDKTSRSTKTKLCWTTASMESSTPRRSYHTWRWSLPFYTPRRKSAVTQISSSTLTSYWWRKTRREQGRHWLSWMFWERLEELTGLSGSSSASSWSLSSTTSPPHKFTLAWWQIIFTLGRRNLSINTTTSSTNSWALSRISRR